MALRPGESPAEEGKQEPADTPHVRPVKDVNNRGANGRGMNERGAGTIAAMGICLALLGFSMTGLILAQASVAAVRAATAADLAALAGADALRGLGPGGATPLSGRSVPGIAMLSGSPPGGDRLTETGALASAHVRGGGDDGCGVARRVALRNGGVVSTCAADEATGILRVETEVAIPALPVPATGKARAGPPG